MIRDQESAFDTKLSMISNSDFHRHGYFVNSDCLNQRITLFEPTSFSRKNSQMQRTQSLLQTLFQNHAVSHALFVARIMIVGYRLPMYRAFTKSSIASQSTSRDQNWLLKSCPNLLGKIEHCHDQCCYSLASLSRSKNLDRS